MKCTVNKHALSELVHVSCKQEGFSPCMDNLDLPVPAATKGVSMLHFDLFEFSPV